MSTCVRLICLSLALALGGSAAGSAGAQSGSEAGSAGAQTGSWDPAAGITFQIQLQGRVDTSVDVDAYDIDMFDVPQEKIDKLHGDGRSVICYISAGTWENWRPDKDDFPRRIRGRKVAGWAGERWLDIRDIDTLRPLMNARLDRCMQKGFDGVDFDNVNGYLNRTGFHLNRNDQIAFDKMLAEIAHDHGLAVGLKNTQELMDQLEPVYDFAVNEQCYQYKECDPYKAFIDDDKPVFIIEYELARSRFCSKAEAAGYTALRKRPDVRAWIRGCWQD